MLTILLTWRHLSTPGDAKIHGVSDPAAMRRSYLLGQLCEDKLAPDWYAQLRSWFDEAAASGLVGEANAIQLATVTPDGHPAVRTVLVKGLDERGIVFYTNQESAKARDLANQPYAAAVFAWLPLERQVRLAGPVAIVTRAETEAYFAAGPADRKSGRGRHRSPRWWHHEPSSTRRSGRSRNDSPTPAFLRHRSGAATGSARTWSSSGRAAPTGCMIGCATDASRTGGRSSASRHDQRRQPASTYGARGRSG